MVEQHAALFPAPSVEAPDTSAHIAAVANEHPITEYEDRTSEAARDQGFGPQEWGTPLEDEDHPRRKPEAIAQEKADRARRRRRIGHRENRYTDIGKDNDASIAADEALNGSSPEPDAEVAARGLLAAKRALAPSRAAAVARDSGNDPRMALALARARSERRQ